MRRGLIVGIDSDLGKSIGNHLEKLGWFICGTTRRKQLVTDTNLYLDITDTNSIDVAIGSFLELYQDWDLVIISIGQLMPIGKITDTDFKKWKESFEINFIHQVYLLKVLLQLSSSLPIKNRKVLTFAGGGTNSAIENFSAYTLAKISLIKATEIFAAEYPRYTFISLGTGWMRSAIHEQTLAAGEKAGKSYEETKRRLEENDFGSLADLFDFVVWYSGCSNPNISGRNIALQGDDWKSSDFVEKLTRDINSFKLRRII